MSNEMEAISNETEVFSKKNREENQRKDHQSENPEQAYEELEKETCDVQRNGRFLTDLRSTRKRELSGWKTD